jgi:hypothetical protein
VTARRAAAAILAVVLVSCGGSSSSTRDDVRTYVDATRAAGKDGGRIIVEEIKPSLNDLRAGRLAPPEFVERAVGWKRDLETVRLAFAAAHPPTSHAGLAEAASLFDRAMHQYEDALDSFAAAATAPGPQLADALAPGIRLAEAADETYDRARSLVDDAAAVRSEPQASTSDERPHWNLCAECQSI